MFKLYLQLLLLDLVNESVDILTSQRDSRVNNGNMLAAGSRDIRYASRNKELIGFSQLINNCLLVHYELLWTTEDSTLFAYSFQERLCTFGGNRVII